MTDEIIPRESELSGDRVARSHTLYTRRSCSKRSQLAGEGGYLSKEGLATGLVNNCVSTAPICPA